MVGSSSCYIASGGEGSKVGAFLSGQAYVMPQKKYAGVKYGKNDKLGRKLLDKQITLS